jgi:RNA recognition motif. (a.k.a. RRM, RBD, or RNP domain)
MLLITEPENWTVYKVWWGNKPAMAKSDLSGVPGYKSFNSLHPVGTPSMVVVMAVAFCRKVFVSCCSLCFFSTSAPPLTHTHEPTKQSIDQSKTNKQRKLFISKLKKIHTEPEVDLRRAELERAFRKYGGARGVTVLVPKNSTFAFVEMESERQADLALQQMASQYRISRARRTRHEALQEERAAAEVGKMGKKKENVDWD